MLAQITKTPYIQTEDVIDIIKNEQISMSPTTPGGNEIDLNGSLEQIITDVIHKVLEQDGMTQAKAAQQLGVCRSTIWKYMKKS